MATVEEVFNHATGLHQAGEVQQAIVLYQKIVAACGDKHSPAMQLLGLALGQIHQHAQAITILKKAITLTPQSSEAHYALANSLIATGQPNTAIVHLDVALKINPALHLARLQRAGLYEDQNQPDQATEDYAHLLKQDPNHIAAHNNLASLLLKQGHTDQAAKHLDHVLQIQPDHLPALCNQAILLQTTNQTQAAIALLKKTCTQHPGQSQPRYQLASIYEQTGDLQQAHNMLQQLTALDPKHLQAWIRRGEIQQQLNQPGQSLIAYDQALRLCPASQTPALKLKRALALPVILQDHEQITLCRQTLIQTLERLTTDNAHIPDPLKEVADTSFFLAYHGQNDRQIQEAISQFYRKASPSLTWVAPHVTQPRNVPKPIRLALISRHLNNHTIGLFMLGIAQHLDRSQFELSVFHVTDKTDPIAQTINQHADFTHVLPTHLQTARQQIARSKPDVLIYPDIGMEPMTYFLAHARLAAVQCVWWGHPVTTGIDTIDYFLSTQALEPDDGDAHYSEKLVRLPTLALYPQQPQPAPNRHPLSHWQIDENAHLYLCCQSLFKMHPDFDPVLKEILKQDDKAQIVFFEGRYPHWHQGLQNRWRQTLSTLSDRIIFLPRQPLPLFLQLIEHAHVILDTLHFTGGNTTLQCLGLGKPIVTLQGPLMKSRITSAAYQDMGMTDLIADNTDEYIQLAVRLGCDKAFNTQMSQQILAKNKPLFDNTQAVRDLESFLKKTVTPT